MMTVKPMRNEKGFGMPRLRGTVVLRAAARAAFVVLALCASGPAAFAAKPPEAFVATLAPAERKAFETYLTAKTQHDQALDTYWGDVATKRSARRAKKGRGEALIAKDYVDSFPPRYAGPELTADLAKRWAAYQAAEEAKSKTPPKPAPTITDFLAHAKREYGFAPDVVPEAEFKLRYAREALSLGLTKDQVLRVYALETSGIGTADMVAGIHPIKKTGKPISTALGYAQLLAANSSDELVNHGAGFLDRLTRMAADASLSLERRTALADKRAKLKAMLDAARSVPHRWNDHIAFARTPKGLGLHAINLDGDIGPWLQVVKLNGLKEMAQKAGRTALTGAEIELMNLAGPGTGLEMMKPAGLDAPTPNFFERGAYARNTIVRDKTSRELLAALDKRMNDNIANSGAIEFAKAFDQAATEHQAAR